MRKQSKYTIALKNKAMVFSMMSRTTTITAHSVYIILRWAYLLGRKAANEKHNKYNPY